MFSAKYFWGSLTILLFLPFGSVFAVEGNGEKIFKTVCMACHTVGSGRLVGPDLKNIHKKHDNVWLKKFITSSSSMIKNGDKKALKIFKEYNRMPMPDHSLSDSQCLELIEYIKKRSLVSSIGKKKKTNNASILIENSNSKQKSSSKSIKRTAEDVILGKALFAGKKRFEKKGAACISCHNVNVSGEIFGGSLAVDLTQVYSRISDNGIASIVKSSPFSVMNLAYDGKELSDDEVFALQAFLQDANQNYAQLIPANYLHRLFGVGIVGVLLLFSLFSIIWKKRKRSSVNQDIYDRQIKSE